MKTTKIIDLLKEIVCKKFDEQDLDYVIIGKEIYVSLFYKRVRFI